MSGPVARRPGDRLRILVTVDSLRDNGGLRVALAHADQWHRTDGVHVSVCAVQDVVDTDLAPCPEDLPIEFLTARGSRFRSTWPLATARLMRQARHADVLLAGSETGIGLLTSWVAARAARRPLAVLVQADVDDAVRAWVTPVLRPITRYVLRTADAAVCVAESLVPGLVDWGLPRDRATVVVNGVDVADIRRRAGLDADDDVPRPRTPDGAPTVIAVGRLSAQKDYPTLVRAHARVLRAGLDHRLLVIGEGPERDTVEAAVAEAGVAGTVSLLGHVGEPHAHMAAADLYVLSSRTEGSPLALLEALSVGAPIIATRCGTGVELLLEEGEYGDLVEPESVEALASAVERHLRAPERLRHTATRGPARAREFDASSAARRVLTVLARLAGRRAAAP